MEGRSMINLNEISAEDLAEQVGKLRPGAAMRTVDGYTLRKCQSNPGYEFIGNPYRYTSPQSIVKALRDKSAKLKTDNSLGGIIPFRDADAATEALAAGTAIEGKHYASGAITKAKADKAIAKVIKVEYVEDATAVAALERISADKKAQPSYRSQARRALKGIKSGTPGAARGALEALIAHAEREGHSRDATNAAQALVAVRDAYPDAAIEQLPTPKVYTVRKTEDGHQLYKGKVKHGTPFTGSRDAVNRASFLNKKARQNAGADEISAHEAGEPVVRTKAAA
jgi:hypothetical protein